MKKVFILFSTMLLLLFSCKKNKENDIDHKLMKLDSLTEKSADSLNLIDNNKYDEDGNIITDSGLNENVKAVCNQIYEDKKYTYFIKKDRLDDEESSFVFDVFPGMKIQDFKLSDKSGDIIDSVYCPYYSGTIGLDDGTNFTQTVDINMISTDILATGFTEADIDDDYKYILAYKKCTFVNRDEVDFSKLEAIYNDYLFWELHGLDNSFRNRAVVLMKVPKKQFDPEDTTASWNDFSNLFASKTKTWDLLEGYYSTADFSEGNLTIFYLKNSSHPVLIIMKSIFSGGNGGGAIIREWYAVDPEKGRIKKICDYSYASTEAVDGRDKYSLEGNNLTIYVFEQEAGCPVNQNDTFVYEQSRDDPLVFNCIQQYKGESK